MDAIRLGRARAFAPCHVTGVVVPDVNARDPRARGSRGAGLVLELGVSATATWAPGARRVVRLRAEPAARLDISREVAGRLLGSRRGVLEVSLAHELPLGHGFGTSAAGALATGLAVASVLRIPRRRAVEVAHLADLFGRGGLGGVAAVLGGGLEVRRRAGLPPFGRVIRRPYPDPVWVGTLGTPIPSPRVLSDRNALARFELASDLVDRLRRHPDPTTFWDVAEEFTGRAGLCPRPLSVALRAMRRRGARAAQAMFGNAFLAAAPPGRTGATFARWLVSRPFHAVATSVARRGARVTRPVRRASRGT